MSKTAYLFPGQGSQYVGMGRDLYQQFPLARERFDAADEVLGFSITGAMFGDDGAAEDDQAARLTRTEITQPALFVHSLATVAVLEAAGKVPDMVAGHSLGEYSALSAAGALGFTEGLRVVRRRGELMAASQGDREGTMAAVLGLDDDEVAAICEEASVSPDDLVRAANFNAPGQVVVSGDASAVERAVDLAKKRGARRAVPLPVSGAFHSPLMKHARDGLEEALSAIEIRRPRCPVYMNVTGEPTVDPAEIRERLLEQLLSPVRWSQILRRMRGDGAARYVEVGAGSVLSGLVRRTVGRDVETQTAGRAEDLK